MRIKTNNVPREVVDASELTTSERADFEYMDWEALEAGADSASFFRYRGVVYDLGEFQRSSGLPADSPLNDWDGFLSESYFSAIVVRYCDDYEWVVVGLALS